MEELDESVWSVVLKKKREDQGKIYRIVVGPALIYGAEKLPLKKNPEKPITLLEVADVQMLL